MQPNPSRLAGRGAFSLICLLLMQALSFPAYPQEQELQELLRRTRAVEAGQLALLETLVAERSRLRERAATFRQLYSEGLVARVKLEELELQLEQVEEDWSRENRRLLQNRQLKLEILAAFEPSGQEALVEKSSGGRQWKLADLPALSLFYENRFGEALPISARGQTELHTRLGFDHRQAADVAIHPDSQAGQAVLTYLRQQEIPYAAYRAAVEGTATGAHIHVGPLSSRLSAR